MQGSLPQDRLSRRLFWDVDPAKLDWELHAEFILPRVMDRGTREEVRMTVQHYGLERVKQALLGARSLHPKTLAYFSVVLDLPREAFRASQMRDPESWAA